LDRMLQEAKSRADIVEREAYDKAYAAGEKSGMALGEKRAEQTLEQMNQLLKQADMQLASLDYMCREAILDISESVVLQLLGEMGEDQHALLMKAVERAAFQFPDLSELIVLVNPNDVQSFEALLPDSALANSRVRGQADVEEGSCRLMSNHQDVLIHPHHALRESFQVLRQQFSS
ncbi:MAG: FliH/SctL family protein, partial [Mariprofundaceae bacterium]|nr:FliH/SctL family protein [Mariprofundaceae bacterium]